MLSFLLTSDCNYSSTDTFLFCVLPPLLTLPFYPWLWANLIEAKIIDIESYQLLHTTTKSETYNRKRYFHIAFLCLSFLQFLSIEFPFHIFVYFHLGNSPLLLSLPPLLPHACLFICLKWVFICLHYIYITSSFFPSCVTLLPPLTFIFLFQFFWKIQQLHLHKWK